MNNNKNVVKKQSKQTTNKRGPRKPRQKESDFKKELDEQIEKKDYNNRPSMYFKDTALMEQVSAFSFNEFLESDGKPFHNTYREQERVPGMMFLYFNPSCGFTRGTSTSDGGINIAAMKIYTKLSSMNAKTTNYAPQDVSTLILALGEVISIYETIRRFFRVVFLYNKRNWNLPKELLAQMGLNADDFIQKLANYRLEFNAVVNSINQISFPGDIEYFAKCAEMYSHIYTDSESPMAQMYVFMPATSWDIDETTFEEGTILKTVEATCNTAGVPQFGRTMGAWINLLRTKIQKILNSATYNYIYADVLRLVDPGKLLTMPYIVEGEGLAPEFDPMMLIQINNLVTAPMPDGALGENTTPANDVYPVADANAVKYAPQFSLTIALHDQAVINFPHTMGNPDVDQRVESTRMVTIVDGDPDTGITEGAALPDHYCIGFRISKGAIDAKLYSTYPKTDATGNPSPWLGMLADLTKFDYAPRIALRDANYNVVDEFGDLDFFTEIDFQYLNKVNDLAYTTLFAIDSLSGADTRAKH